MLSLPHPFVRFLSQLANWCCNPDVLYHKFGRELESFTETLQQLVTIIKHANGQRPRRPWGYPDDECRVALHPVSQAIGDFRKTIADCERLLNDNERFQRDSAGFVDNVVWHLSTQRDVEILRERVHFHKTKVRNEGCQSTLDRELTLLAPSDHEAFRDVSDFLILFCE